MKNEPNQSTIELKENASLEEAQVYWAEIIQEDGGLCPCCARFGKIYKRNINGTMAKGLIWLVSQWVGRRPNGWIDVPETAPRWLIRSNQLSTMKWWGFVERPEIEDSNEKSSGFWRPTQKGIDFVNDLIEVPESVYTYDGDVLGFDGRLVKISQCKGKKFDYRQIMTDTFKS